MTMPAITPDVRRVLPAEIFPSGLGARVGRPLPSDDVVVSGDAMVGVVEEAFAGEGIRSVRSSTSK